MYSNFISKPAARSRRAPLDVNLQADSIDPLVYGFPFCQIVLFDDKVPRMELLTKQFDQARNAGQTLNGKAFEGVFIIFLTVSVRFEGDEIVFGTARKVFTSVSSLQLNVCQRPVGDKIFEPKVESHQAAGYQRLMASV